MSEAIPPTFDEFVGRMAGLLSVDPEDLRPGSRLREDTGVDSLQMLELLVFLEVELDAELPEALVPQLITVDDVYEYFVVRWGQVA